MTGPLAERSELAQLTNRGLVPSIVKTPAGAVGVIVVVYANGLQQVYEVVKMGTVFETCGEPML